MWLSYVIQNFDNFRNSLNKLKGKQYHICQCNHLPISLSYTCVQYQYKQSLQYKYSILSYKLFIFIFNIISTFTKRLNYWFYKGETKYETGREVMCCRIGCFSILHLPQNYHFYFNLKVIVFRKYEMQRFILQNVWSVKHENEFFYKVEQVVKRRSYTVE